MVEISPVCCQYLSFISLINLSRTSDLWSKTSSEASSAKIYQIWNKLEKKIGIDTKWLEVWTADPTAHGPAHKFSLGNMFFFQGMSIFL